MRDHPWTRAAIGGGIGLVAALLMGFWVAVFWFPIGIGLAVFLGAVIASLRPIPAAMVVWTVQVYWFTLINGGGGGGFGSVGFVRAWGPPAALWLVGMTVIGAAWLVSSRGWPKLGASALVVSGILTMLIGSLLWASLAQVPAHSILLGISNSMLWKAVLLPGAALYLIGFALATGRAMNRRALITTSVALITAVAISAFIVLVFLGPIKPYVHHPIESLEQLQ